MHQYLMYLRNYRRCRYPQYSGIDGWLIDLSPCCLFVELCLFIDNHSENGVLYIHIVCPLTRLSRPTQWCTAQLANGAARIQTPVFSPISQLGSVDWDRD